MEGKLLALPREVSRTCENRSMKHGRNKVCREKSAEAIVLCDD